MCHEPDLCLRDSLRDRGEVPVEEFVPDDRGRAVAEFFPPAPPPDSKSPGGFRFAQPGVLESVLIDAGYSDIVVQSLSMPIDCASVSEYWQVFTDMAAGIKNRIATLPAADQARLEASVREAAGACIETGRVRLQATPLCALARAHGR